VKTDTHADKMVRVPEDLYARLSNLSAKTGRSRTRFVRQAIEDLLDDCEDALLAAAAQRETKKSYTLEEAARKLGVAL
jgi:RHH-type rel operon transcriptional repressor/antitoxin RelB